MKFRGLAVPQMSQRTVAIPAPPPALRPQQRVPGELRTGTGTGTGSANACTWNGFAPSLYFSSLL